jgi:Zn-dependent protease/predicted transcriptional regulator
MIVLGRLAGIEIRAHYSTLLVFGALTSILAFGYLPAVTPAAAFPERLAVAVVVAGLFAGSILAHELAHAWVARRLGHSVNGVTLYLFGGIAHVSGPRARPTDDIAIGLAGPAASALLAGLFIAAGGFVLTANQQAAFLLLNIGFVNALLLAVNVLPGYPMDGGMVLRGVLWNLGGNVIAATRRACVAGKLIAYSIAAGGIWLLLRGDVPSGMWVVLIGWLLAGMAESTYRSILTRTALEGLVVKDLCARDLPVLQTSETVAMASALLGAGGMSRVLPAMFGERIAGVVTDIDVARVPHDQAATTPISSIMLRTGAQPMLDGDCDALLLVPILPQSAARCAIVVDENGDYVGLVRQEDVARYVDMIEALGNSAEVSSRRLRRLFPRREHVPAEQPKPADPPA